MDDRLTQETARAISPLLSPKAVAAVKFQITADKLACKTTSGSHRDW